MAASLLNFCDIYKFVIENSVFPKRVGNIIDKVVDVAALTDIFLS